MKHSELGILAFVTLISTLVPLSMIFVFRWWIIRIFDYEQILLISKFFTCWVLMAPIISFVLSIIDLKKPDRLKTLSKITVVINSTVISVGIIWMIVRTIIDISRLYR